MLQPFAPFLLAVLSSSPAQPQPAAANLGQLTITCPDLFKFTCGDDSDPGAAGTPTVTGECDPNIPATLTYVDSVVTEPCPANRFEAVITRTWTATDSCGNTASCEQTLDQIKQVWNLDIKSPSCPNPFLLGGNGVISMTIVGTAQNDVTNIDPATIQIWTTNCAAGPVAPIRYNYEDKATPWPGGLPCGCHTLGADGILDLNFHLKRSDVQAGLGLGSYPPFTYVRIFFSAQTLDGCGVIGSDCVRVQ
jgi:hypothetical protein